jgi:hypothetical protein
MLNLLLEQICHTKLIVAQLPKKFPAFVYPECSQQPSTGLYPEPNKSRPHLTFLLLQDPFLATFPYSEKAVGGL